MEKLTDIKNGDLTNRGVVKMIDTPWLNSDGNVADRLVSTTQGFFRETELTVIEKSDKPIIELKPSVDFNTVSLVDIRPCSVKSAVRIPNTDKLLHLVIKSELGDKNVVTNLGEKYTPEDFIGNKFMFVMNMPPVKMRGVLSEAMIMAEDTFKFNEITNDWEPDVKLIKCV